MRIYDGSDGKQYLCDSRLTKGEDATYLSMTFDAETGMPPDIRTVVYVNDSAHPFVVREVSHDMRTDRYSVQAIDEASFRRKSRFVPRPPRFASVEEADAWLERFGG